MAFEKLQSSLSPPPPPPAIEKPKPLLDFGINQQPKRKRGGMPLGVIANIQKLYQIPAQPANAMPAQMPSGTDLQPGWGGKDR